MIQTGTYVNVIDNSGAKKAYCIKILKGYRKRYSSVGDCLLVSIIRLRTHRKSFSKVKTGQLYRAIIIRVKACKFFRYGDSLNFLENSVVLLSKQNKNIGTRIFGAVPSYFRFTRFMKLLSISSGILI